MTKVLILGASGMLGSAMLKEFAAFKGDVIATKRPSAKIDNFASVEVRKFDAETDDISSVAFDLDSEDFIINCIGVVKSQIDEGNPSDIKKAERLNTGLPMSIADFVSGTKVRVIQIATDCVFSGCEADHAESSFHDAVDTYGKTKSLGEVGSSNFMHIRVSIIGPEIQGHTSLYDWVRMQPKGAKINGYVNHLWNGITTLHFAKICKAIIEKQLFVPGLVHLVPADSVTKLDLVGLIARHVNRDDLQILPFETEVAVNRVLTTEKSKINLDLWKAIGYHDAPSIRQLIAEI